MTKTELLGETPGCNRDFIFAPLQLESIAAKTTIHLTRVCPDIALMVVLAWCLRPRAHSSRAQDVLTVPGPWRRVSFRCARASGPWGF